MTDKKRSPQPVPMHSFGYLHPPLRTESEGSESVPSQPPAGGASSSSMACSHSRTASGTHSETPPSENVDLSEQYKGPVTTINSTAGKFFDVLNTPQRICKHTVKFFPSSVVKNKEEVTQKKEEVKKKKREEVTKTSLKRLLMAQFVRNVLSKLGRSKPIIDGADVIYSMGSLDDNLAAAPSENFYSFEFDGLSYQVHVARHKDIKYEDLKQCAEERKYTGGKDCPIREYVHALNVLLHSVLRESEDWMQVRGNLYLPKKCQSKPLASDSNGNLGKCPPHVELRRGLSFSIDFLGAQHPSVSEKVNPPKLRFATNVRPTYFVKSCNLGDLYKDYEKKIEHMNWPDSERETALRSFIKGLNVQLGYKPNEHAPKAKKIKEPKAEEDVPKDSRERRVFSAGQNASEQTFKIEKDKKQVEISVKDYFKDYKSHQIDRPELPVVDIEPGKRKTWIPMGLIWVQEQPIFRRPPSRKNEDFKDMQRESERMIREFGINLVNQDDDVVKLLNPEALKTQFHLSFMPETETLHGRFLFSSIDELREKFGNASIDRIQAPKFTNSPSRVHFLSFNPGSGEGSNISPEKYRDCCNKLREALHTEGGMNDRAEPTYPIESKVPEIGKFKISPFDREKDLLFVGLAGPPQERSNFRAAVRLWSESGSRVPVVFFRTQKFVETMKYWEKSQGKDAEHNIRRALGYARGLITKAVHRGDTQSIPVVGDKLQDLLGSDGLLSRTMIVGASLVPGQRGSSGNLPSIAAVVAMTSKDPIQFEGQFRLQISEPKTIQNLTGMLKDLLLRYAEIMKALPESILYFRDRVVDDRFDLIKSEETLKITHGFQQALDQIKSGPQSNKKKLKTPDSAPKINIIALSDGEKTRFFPNGGAVGQETKKNLKGGIIVDTTDFQKPGKREQTLDFHLQSHSNHCEDEKQCGFISNTHYFVLKNESEWTGEDIKRLTNRLCLINAVSAAASYVTPVYYSRKICRRGQTCFRALVPVDEPRLTEEKLTELEKSERWPKSSSLEKIMFWL